MNKETHVYMSITLEELFQILKEDNFEVCYAVTRNPNVLFDEEDDLILVRVTFLVDRDNLEIVENRLSISDKHTKEIREKLKNAIVGIHIRRTSRVSEVIEELETSIQKKFPNSDLIIYKSPVAQWDYDEMKFFIWQRGSDSRKNVYYNLK